MPKAPSQLIGESPAFRKALDDAAVAAAQDAPVLLYGETGSGKGIVAEYIHIKSGRKGQLVSLNCATFQPNLFESELFGYMKGAFTGALKDTPGLFETADGGTLFLDEIGDMPVELQPKLLRALEEGVIRRVGGTKEIEVDVRLVCATNKDLQGLIETGQFREDLYYRINSFVVHLPALRERKEDIAELARHFLRDFHKRGDMNPPQLSVEAIEALENYAWPGNVRELRSAMSYAAAQATGRKTILAKDLPTAVIGEAPANKPRGEDTPDGYKESFRELYRRGAEDPQLWAKFLLAFNTHLGSNKFARSDMLDCLREVRGPEPTNNSLVNEWQRHIKPVPLSFGLVSEEGKKLRINIDACQAMLEREATAAFPVQTPSEPEPEAPPVQRSPIQDRSRLTNIDAARTSFVGREHELTELIELIQSGEHNLVTVTGPGGTGKTRLSREAGRRLASEIPGGVWFADLTESREVEGVSYAVAQAIGVPLTGKQSPEIAVGEILSSRPATLLILDNFEQVAEAASSTVSDWARSAPQVRFLVTSRALLGVEDEREFNLASLSLPDLDADVEEIANNEAARLFVDRARVHHVGFQLDEKNASAIARICKRLEGMPLAIELAAARTVIMQPEQIANRLDRAFDTLKSSRRDLAPRQRSLLASLDWSFDLLNDVERWGFAQLSVFRGGFFLDAAESILDLSRFNDPPEPIDIIQGLREKSLLRAYETPFETRFAMYQMIREYAADKWAELASDVERAAVEQRHAEHYGDLVSEWAPQVYTEDAVDALDRLDIERPNVEAAMEWALKAPEDDLHRKVIVELANNFSNLLRVRGPAQSRVPYLRRALEALDGHDERARARILGHLSLAEQEAGDPRKAREAATDALALAEASGDDHAVATARFHMAGMEFGVGRYDKAQEIHRDVLPVFEKHGDELNVGRVLSRMALTASRLGNFEEALECSERSEEIMRRRGDLSGLAFSLGIRSNVYLQMGRNEEALKEVEASERIYRELKDKRMIMLSTGNRALITKRLRRFRESEELLLECTRLAREMGDRYTLGGNLMNSGLMYVEMGELDKAETAFLEARQVLHAQKRTPFEGVCAENLGFIRGMKGDFERARELFDEAEKLMEGEESGLTSIYTARAEVLLEEGRAEEAAQYAARASVYWEGDGPAGRDKYRTYTIHARSLAATGKKDQAVKAARKALEVGKQLGYSDEDPSPVVLESLRNLKKLA